MKIQKRNILILIFTHSCAVIVGFAIGIYALPILIAPPSPSETEIQEAFSQSVYKGHFTRDLKGSDALHWGEGEVSVGNDYISFMGKLAPGPDYKLYLSPDFVETEEQFESLKSSMALIGDVKTFENFIVEMKPEVDVNSFNTVVVWCESFGEFITAAKYR
jgi:Electron transfer DM13